MKIFAISDNNDSLMALRLMGIESVVLHEKDEVISKLNELILDDEIGIILLTTNIVSLAPEVVFDYKLNIKNKLISEIPDRHIKKDIGSEIDSYISSAIGIKL